MQTDDAPEPQLECHAPPDIGEPAITEEEELEDCMIM
jgi:hypothetical protein